MSSSYGFHPQAVATNESYSWTNDLGVDSTVYLRLLLNEMTEDYESNYTVTFSTYNATEEPWQMACQDDAGQAPIGGCLDAGDSYLEPLNLTTVNQTFEGWGHDSMDTLRLLQGLPAEQLRLRGLRGVPRAERHRPGPLLPATHIRVLLLDRNSYNDNPECVWAQYDDADRTSSSRVWTDRGSVTTRSRSPWPPRARTRRQPGRLRNGGSVPRRRRC